MKPIVNTFIIHGKINRIIINQLCLLCEPQDKPNYRTVVRLNQIISIHGCHCGKNKDICDCINSNIAKDSNREIKVIKCIRLYYALPSGKLNWRLRSIVFHIHQHSHQQLVQFISDVENLLKAEFKRPSNLIVFINPYGGQKKGPKIFHNKILPLFNVAKCKVESITTTRANHAKDLLTDSNFSIDQYDGIVCVGGDGMFAEILNGILIRTQEKEGIDRDSLQSTPIKPLISLGVIPAGSTDAVAFSVIGSNDPVTAAIHIILGNRVNIDVNGIHSIMEEKLIRYSTSFMGYGYFGDILKESEKYRWMGPSRYDWAGFKKVLKHQVYQGNLKLNVSTDDGSPRDSNFCTSDCSLCAKSAFRSKCNGIIDTQKESEKPKESWIHIKGRFIAINSATMSCRCGKSKRGISPAAHLGNGCADLIIVSKCSRLNYLRYMMRIGYSAKSPFDLDFVDVYRIKEFEFTPIVRPNSTSKYFNQSDASVWNCDGEVINEPAVHVRIHCQLLSVFGMGTENRVADRGSVIFSKNKVQDIQKKVLKYDVNKNEDGIDQSVTKSSAKDYF